MSTITDWEEGLMKKIVALTVLTAFLVMAFAVPAMAVKPTLNLAAAKVVPWFQSSAVMPVPPYGSYDIPGADLASKLIVNQPNGNTEVAITGVMNGLAPLSTYTVFLSNAYTPYAETGWNVTGSYTIDLTVGAAPYTEYLNLVQDSAGNITGNYLAMNAAGTASRWNITDGLVAGDQLSFVAHYENTTLTADFSATIAPNGSLINGVWHDRPGFWRYVGGSWSSKVGAATKTYSGSTGWPGMFNTQTPFTFTTDESGAGSWHVNLKDADFASEGTYALSVWINSGGTMLISDVFTVVK